MTRPELSCAMGIVIMAILAERPKFLCTALGLTDSGVMEFHLLNESTGASAVITETMSAEEADKLAWEMVAIIRETNKEAA